MGRFTHKRLPSLYRKASGHAPSKPIPFRQGSLDSLCGLYALINALRLAQSKGAFKARIDWHLVFRDLLEALDRKWWLRDIVYDGMDTKELQFCLTTAKAYLWRRHRILMQVAWPWKKKQRLTLTPELQKLRLMLERPNTVAMLSYSLKAYDHWSVIQEIRQDCIILCDSLGNRPLRLSHLHFNAQQILRSTMTYVVGSEDLIVLEFEDAKATSKGRS